jgi:hypothetical protein
MFVPNGYLCRGLTLYLVTEPSTPLAQSRIERFLHVLYVSCWPKPGICVFAAIDAVIPHVYAEKLKGEPSRKPLRHTLQDIWPVFLASCKSGAR